MAKVIDFDEAKKKVEDMSNKINILMSNRLIIAILLIVDGINFILNLNVLFNEEVIWKKIKYLKLFIIVGLEEEKNQN